ncbi:MAG: adenylyltransferase/cytidyltransferase family protein, partial [Candidatus Moraniibacteriota bacterium]
MDKIIAGQCQLSDICDQLRLDSKRIVLTTGAFDLLHEGHLRYLEEAKSFGDALVVGINNDQFVKNLKGQERPIIDEAARAFMIAGFECVDYVHIFGNRLEIV